MVHCSRPRVLLSNPFSFLFFTLSITFGILTMFSTNTAQASLHQATNRCQGSSLPTFPQIGFIQDLGGASSMIRG
jgi:hypothetical protein